MAQFTNSSISQFTINSFSTSSTLSTFCQQWNQLKRQQIDLELLTNCFIRNKIDNLYFNNTKRKDFMSLLKQECGIKAAASSSLWKFIRPSPPHPPQTDNINLIKIPKNNPSSPESLGLQRLSELETENMSLKQQNLSLTQQNSRYKHQYKLLLSSHYELIKLLLNNNGTDHNKEIKSTLELPSDWEQDEMDKKNDIFDTYLAEHGLDSSSEENQP